MEKFQLEIQISNCNIGQKKAIIYRSPPQPLAWRNPLLKTSFLSKLSKRCRPNLIGGLAARPNEKVLDSIPQPAAFPRQVQRHADFGQDDEVEQDVSDG